MSCKAAANISLAHVSAYAAQKLIALFISVKPVDISEAVQVISLYTIFFARIFLYPFLHFLSLSGLQGIQPRQMAKRIAHPAREPMKTAAPESQETSQVKILQNMAKPLLKV